MSAFIPQEWITNNETDLSGYAKRAELLHYAVKNAQGEIDAVDKKIVRVGDAQNETDVLNQKTGDHRYVGKSVLDTLAVKTDLDDCVKRTAAGDVDMRFKKIKHVFDPIENYDAANKQYVDSKKHVISIIAEAVGRIAQSGNNFSFGGGGARGGYVTHASGKLLSISAVSKLSSDGGRVRVGVLRGFSLIANAYIEVSGPGTIRKEVKRFNPPIPVREGDVLNFIPIISTPNAVKTTVSLLIELNI